MPCLRKSIPLPPAIGCTQIIFFCSFSVNEKKKKEIKGKKPQYCFSGVEAFIIDIRGAHRQWHLEESRVNWAMGKRVREEEKRERSHGPSGQEAKNQETCRVKIAALYRNQRSWGMGNQAQSLGWRV